MSFTQSSGGSQGGPPLVQRAYAEIRDRLVFLEIRPGDPIREEALAQVMGTGRTPVREALKQLQMDRLVVIYPRRGAFASSVTVSDLTFISEIRRELEPLAAAKAARNCDPETRQRLAALAALAAQLDETASRTGEHRRLMEWDVQLHRAIYAASGNPYLEDILVRQDNLATRIWGMFIDRLPNLTGHVVEHRALLEAIAEGDQDRAAALALAHVSSFDTSVRAVM